MSGFLDARIDMLLGPSTESLPKDGCPAFITTKDASQLAPSGATLKQRFLDVWFTRKRITGYRFAPFPPQRCGVKGVLDQCMEVSGKRYLIAREAVAGTVSFGHTNTLTGPQWVAAFEQALRDGGLVLLSNKNGVVKVIPKNKVEEYRKAGLVKSNE
jgi:hypothetical protein